MLRWLIGIILGEIICESSNWQHIKKLKFTTVRAEIFAVVLFSRISRVKPSRKFPLQFMSIYSNDNISKIAKLTTRECTAPGQNRENNCTRN